MRKLTAIVLFILIVCSAHCQTVLREATIKGTIYGYKKKTLKRYPAYLWAYTNESSKIFIRYKFIQKKIRKDLLPGTKIWIVSQYSRKTKDWTPLSIRIIENQL